MHLILLLNKTVCVIVCVCAHTHAPKETLYFLSPVIIVNDGKAQAGFFERLSQKSLTAASCRNPETPNQHFVIGTRKLHPLCNNMFLFGGAPDGPLPISTWQTDQIILCKNIGLRNTVIIPRRQRSGRCKAHKYKWDETYGTNLITASGPRIRSRAHAVIMKVSPFAPTR